MNFLIINGVILGWSVAWPPGPINTEIILRDIMPVARPAWQIGTQALSALVMVWVAVHLALGLLARH